MTSALTDFVGDTTLIPFSLWATDDAQVRELINTKLPHLRAWLALARRVMVQVEPAPAPLLATLSPPHEQAWAQALGWPVVDGCLPWAAQAAAAGGLLSNALTSYAEAADWAFITLCHWQVSNGQVIMADPTQLDIDAATDTALMHAMQRFFAEDGIALYPYQAGQWLAQSPLFVGLPTASLDRVVGRQVEPWMVGSQAGATRLSAAATRLRRLQSEMQMWLYTHPLNEGRKLAINSFWLHGTGALPSAANDAGGASHTQTTGSKQAQAHTPASSEPTLVDALRHHALQQDFAGWLEAWQHVDAQVIAPMLAHVAAGEPQRLVLCGEHEFHVYDSAPPTLWQRLRQHLRPISLDTVLTVAPLKD